MWRVIRDFNGLPLWHPLITGDPESVHRAGVSVRNQTISEASLEEEDDALDFTAWDLAKDKSDNDPDGEDA